MKLFLLLCLTINSMIYGDCFEKNDELIETFRTNDLKIIVLYNFESTHNVLNIVTSSRSPGYCLTARGKEDLENSIPVLLPEKISTIYSALAFRAQQSTNLLGSALLLPNAALKVDARLGVQNIGDYDGMDYNLYKIRFGTVVDMLEGTPPNGESGCSLYKRTTDFLKSLANLQNETVLIVTHSFNFAHISKILTGQYETLPSPGDFRVYDFTIPVAR